MNKYITISGSSFLLPNNQAWEKIKFFGAITHNDYGDWSGSLVKPKPALAFDGARVIFFLTPLRLIFELIEDNNG